MKKRIARAAIQSFFISVCLVFIQWLAKSYYGEWAWASAALSFAICFVVFGVGFFLESLWQKPTRPYAEGLKPHRFSLTCVKGTNRFLRKSTPGPLGGRQPVW